MNREEDPELWDLLGQVQTVEPSHFFARNVLREIRNTPVRLSWWERLPGRRVLIPTFAAAAALLITVAVVRFQPQRSSPPVAASTEHPADRIQVAVALGPKVGSEAAPAQVARQPVMAEDANATSVSVQADEPLVADFKLLAEADDDSDDAALLL